jgi:hypothetical protein
MIIFIISFLLIIIMTLDLYLVLKSAFFKVKRVIFTILYIIIEALKTNHIKIILFILRIIDKEERKSYA